MSNGCTEINKQKIGKMTLNNVKMRYFSSNTVQKRFGLMLNCFLPFNLFLFVTPNSEMHPKHFRIMFFNQIIRPTLVETEMSAFLFLHSLLQTFYFHSWHSFIISSIQKVDRILTGGVRGINRNFDELD